MAPKIPDATIFASLLYLEHCLIIIKSLTLTSDLMLICHLYFIYHNHIYPPLVICTLYIIIIYITIYPPSLIYI